MFLDGFHDRLRRGFVAESLERECAVSLRLAAEPQPVFTGLTEEIIHGLALRRSDGPFFDEKAAPVQVERNRWIEMIVIAGLCRDVPVNAVEPAVEVRE